MRLFDLLFASIETEHEIDSKAYKFYSITPEHKFLFYGNSGLMDDLDFDEYAFDYLSINSCEVYDDPVYIEYSNLKPLFNITVEGYMGQYGGVNRNQFVAVRGTCNHKCQGNCPDDYTGYTLHKLPCCDKKYIGSTMWTGKWNNNADTINDIWNWLKYCKGLDVLIINFDYTPGPEEGLDFEHVCFCALVKGTHIRFISDKEEIGKLYYEYSNKYWCMDYKIEESINFDNEGSGVFKLEKPPGRKEDY